jgi:hypothetical protein
MEDRMLSDEILLALIKKAGSGTDDYEDLENKPQIGGTTLIGNKSLGDLGIKNEFVGTLEEWEQLTIEEKKSFDTYQITNDFISGGNFEIKKKDYTGDGQTTKTIDFGTETPKMIVQIVTDPAVEQSGDWHCIHAFPWGSKMSEVRWSTGSNNAPNASGNGGNYTVGISYSGNVMTITGRDAGGACNMNNRAYSVYYVVPATGGSSVPQDLSKLKIVEYTGTGETQHSINIGENAKYISWFARKDSAVWTNSFIPTQTQVRVIWRTPNSGENNITLSFASGVLTINGVDAGQTMNSEGVDYVLVYFE